MAALAAPPPISSGMSRAPAGPPRDERPTSFTAVNGSYRRGSHSEAHVIGDTITVATDKQPPYHQAHDHSRPTPPPSRQENLYMDFRNGTIDQQQLPSPTETSVNSAKRKRSISEDEVSPSMPPAQRPHMRHGHQHSFDDQHFHQQSNHRSREVHSDGEQALNEERTRQRSGDTSRTSPSSGRPDSYLTEQQQYAEPLSSETDRPSRGFPPSNNAPQWEQPPSYPQGYHDENEQTGTENTGRPPSSQRSSEHQGSHGSWAFTHSHQDSNEPEDSSYQDNGQPQANPKRKRNFSNRTKTGCMTCRKRKKKCDEAHPFCRSPDPIFVLMSWYLRGIRTRRLYFAIHIRSTALPIWEFGLTHDRSKLFAWRLHVRRLQQQGILAEDQQPQNPCATSVEGRSR